GRTEQVARALARAEREQQERGGFRAMLLTDDSSIDPTIDPSIDPALARATNVFSWWPEFLGNLLRARLCRPRWELADQGAAVEETLTHACLGLAPREERWREDTGESTGMGGVDPERLAALL